MSSFKERLKQVRGKFTQAEISEKLEVPFVTFGRYERGERIPGMEFIAKICRDFNISPAWLIMGLGPMHRDEAAAALPDQAGPVPALGEHAPEPYEARPGPPLDVALVAAVFGQVREYLKQKRLRPTAAQEARLATLVYDTCQADKIKPDQVMVDRRAWVALVD